MSSLATDPEAPVGLLHPWTARLGGEAFYAGWDNYDTNGDSWVLESIEGWDSPGSSGEVNQRTYTHGGWASRAFYAPKVFTINALVEAGGDNRLDAIIDRVLGAIPLDEFEPLVVSRDGRDRTVWVRQDGEPEVEILNNRLARFAIPLISADGFKYGGGPDDGSANRIELELPWTVGGLTFPVEMPFIIGAERIGGAQNAENAGNVDAYPVVLITGPVDHPKIINHTTGGSLEYQSTLQAEHTLEYDMVRRTVILNDTVSRRGYVEGSFWTLRPGDNRIGFTSPDYNPEARAVLTWRDTYK